MADNVVETVCTNCAHSNICRWKEDFLRLVQEVNVAQSAYNVCVAKQIAIECYEWLPQTKTSRNIS